MLYKRFGGILAAIFMAALSIFLPAIVAALVPAALLFINSYSERVSQPRSLSSAPLHVKRGHSVQQHYDEHRKLLQSYFVALTRVFKATAPDLLPLLEPPNALHSGYPAPKIIPDDLDSKVPTRAQSAHYSWPWTDELIQKAMTEIDRSNKELARAGNLSSAARRKVYHDLARGYRQIRERQLNIEEHIQYNLMWQREIAANRSNYDRETVLHDRVLERQAVLDILDAQRFGLNLAKRPLSRIAASEFIDVRANLSEREKLLAAEIARATDHLSMPSYVSVRQPSERLWIVHVPFLTDLEDTGFVRSIQRHIERAWHLRSGDDEFRLDLDFKHISAGELYNGGELPHGNQLDIQEHLNLFPTEGAILTTGGAITHVLGRAIVLGPHDIPSRVLAHEFGHILGFKDMYFRGYKDLGKDGFQVMEVAADSQDIMGTPITGAVMRRHYERLIKTYRNLEPQKQLIRSEKSIDRNGSTGRE